MRRGSGNISPSLLESTVSACGVRARVQWKRRRGRGGSIVVEGRTDGSLKPMAERRCEGNEGGGGVEAGLGDGTPERVKRR